MDNNIVLKRGDFMIMPQFKLDNKSGNKYMFRISSIDEVSWNKKQETIQIIVNGIGTVLRFNTLKDLKKILDEIFDILTDDLNPKIYGDIQ